jgi:glycerol uptake facilitator protein
MVEHLARRLVAETIGTLMLVLFGVGSVVAALAAGDGQLDYAGLGFIAVSFAIIVAVIIYGFGTTSGAHINPAVTIALTVGRRFPWRETPFYIGAQLLGAVLGALLIVAIFGGRAVDFGVGLTALGPDVGYVQGIVAEIFGTFLLLFAVMALAVDRRAPSGWAGWVIGLAVAGEIFVIGPLTGGSINPARTFGPYVVTSLFGGETPWAQFGVYIIGPLVGGALAVITYDLVARPTREIPAAEQGTAGEIVGARRVSGEAPAETPQGTAGEITGSRRPEGVAEHVQGAPAPRPPSDRPGEVASGRPRRPGRPEQGR